MPAAAKGKGRPAAKAFVRYYIDLINYAESTGDAAALGPLVTSECRDCADLRRKIASTYRDGGWFKTSGWVPSVVAVVRRSEQATVMTAIRSPEQRYKPSTAEPVERIDASRFTMEFALKRTKGHWFVDRLVRK
jgi:hypothetical protein